MHIPIHMGLIGAAKEPEEKSKKKRKKKRAFGRAFGRLGKAFGSRITSTAEKAAKRIEAPEEGKVRLPLFGPSFGGGIAELLGGGGGIDSGMFSDMSDEELDDFEAELDDAEAGYAHMAGVGSFGVPGFGGHRFSDPENNFSDDDLDYLESELDAELAHLGLDPADLDEERPMAWEAPAGPGQAEWGAAPYDSGLLRSGLPGQSRRGFAYDNPGGHIIGALGGGAVKG